MTFPIITKATSQPPRGVVKKILRAKPTQQRQNVHTKWCKAFSEMGPVRAGYFSRGKITAEHYLTAPQGVRNQCYLF